MPDEYRTRSDEKRKIGRLEAPLFDEFFKKPAQKRVFFRKNAHQTNYLPKNGIAN